MPTPAPVAQLLGCLSRTIPVQAIQAALAQTGKGERRRRSLPATLVVQLIICLGLVADAASRQVASPDRVERLLGPLDRGHVMISRVLTT